MRRLAAHPDELGRADLDLYFTLVDLEERAGVEPGRPFRTTRAQMLVEAGLYSEALDCGLYRLERDSWIKRTAKAGTGTIITILRRP